MTYVHSAVAFHYAQTSKMFFNNKPRAVACRPGQFLMRRQRIEVAPLLGSPQNLKPHTAPMQPAVNHMYPKGAIHVGDPRTVPAETTTLSRFWGEAMGKSKLKGFSIGFIGFIGRERLPGWCGCKILYACKRKGSFLSSATHHQRHSLSSQFYVLPQGRLCL